MSFSPRQQGIFRPLVQRAWLKHCGDEDANANDRAAKDAWYRAELLKCIGVDSTKASDKGRAFETCMAHFETIARGDITWNMRQHDGDIRRLLWQIERICDQHNIDHAYARATAAKLLKWRGYLNSLAEIEDPEDLQKVRIALIRHAKRQSRTQPTPPPIRNTAPRTPRRDRAAGPTLVTAVIDPENCPF